MSQLAPEQVHSANDELAAHSKLFGHGDGLHGPVSKRVPNDRAYLTSVHIITSEHIITSVHIFSHFLCTLVKICSLVEVEVKIE